MAVKSKQKVFEAIIKYIDDHQYPPTVRELCEMTGLNSTSSVQAHINNLLNEGRLETDCGIGFSRALRVPGYKFVKIYDVNSLEGVKSEQRN